jgi:hypothetical protein
MYAWQARQTSPPASLQQEMGGPGNMMHGKKERNERSLGTDRIKHPPPHTHTHTQLCVSSTNSPPHIISTAQCMRSVHSIIVIIITTTIMI